MILYRSKDRLKLELTAEEIEHFVNVIRAAGDRYSEYSHVKYPEGEDKIFGLLYNNLVDEEDY